MTGERAISAEDLHGTWLLRDYRFRFADGTEVPRYEAGSDGWLHYLPNGWMSAHLTARGRAGIGDDAAALSAEAARSALGTYLSYGGRWALEGDRVRHEVEVCLRQDWVGRTLWRRARFDGTRLVLTAEGSRFGAREGTATLSWEKG